MPVKTETEAATLAEDLVKLQAALPTMPKDAINPFFKSKYTPYDTIKATIQPIMAKYNFAWVTRPSFNEAHEPTLKYSLIHISGESIDGEMKLLSKGQDPQGQGAAITYARRYSLSSVLDLVSDEDDDGNAARKAAEAAKTIDPLPPEEPSVQVEKPDKIALVKHMRKLQIEKGYETPDDATGLYQLVLKKAGPTTTGEIQQVIEHLEAL